jgi:hypothetical protein
MVFRSLGVKPYRASCSIRLERLWSEANHWLWWITVPPPTRLLAKGQVAGVGDPACGTRRSFEAAQSALEGDIFHSHSAHVS